MQRGNSKKNKVEEKRNNKVKKIMMNGEKKR